MIGMHSKNHVHMMVDSMWTIQLSKMSVESFQNRDVKVLF